MSHLHLQIRNKQLHCFRKEALSIWFKTPGSYPFNQKFRKFWNTDRWWRNFQGKFLGNPEIAEFPNIHPKIISQGCPLFLNLQKIMLHSAMAIFESSYPNFSSQGKRPWFENFQWRMKQHFSQYSKKETTWSWCSPKFQAISYPEFSFHLIFIVKVCEILGWILRFSRNWTAFWKICVGNQMISNAIWNKGRHTRWG